MAKGQITDADLVDSNIKDGVEIFGIVGDYTNNVLDKKTYFLGGPAMSWDLGSNGGFIPRGDLKFYDDGTKIIIMGSSDVQASGAGASQHGAAAYYAEILKSTGVLTVYPEWAGSLGTTMDWGSNKLVHLGGTTYGYTRTSLVGSLAYFYFDGTQVQIGNASAIRAASNIGSSSISYRGRTLQKGVLLSNGNTVFYGAGGACLQTLQYS